MSVEREMSLVEWCAKLPSLHLVNQELSTLNTQLAALAEQNKQLKAELKSIDGALDDPRANLTLTTSEIILELKEQVEKLTEAYDQCGRTVQDYGRTIDQTESRLREVATHCANVEQQLAAALVACEEKNRGLDKLARLGNEPYLGNSVGNRIAAEFLAIKPNASILKQHDAELIERCADKLAICLAKDEPWEPAIRELKAEL